MIGLDADRSPVVQPHGDDTPVVAGTEQARVRAVDLLLKAGKLHRHQLWPVVAHARTADPDTVRVVVGRAQPRMRNSAAAARAREIRLPKSYGKQHARECTQVLNRSLDQAAIDREPERPYDALRPGHGRTAATAARRRRSSQLSLACPR